MSTRIDANTVRSDSLERYILNWWPNNQYNVLTCLDRDTGDVNDRCLLGRYSWTCSREELAANFAKSWSWSSPRGCSCEYQVLTCRCSLCKDVQRSRQGWTLCGNFCCQRLDLESWNWMKFNECVFKHGLWMTVIRMIVSNCEAAGGFPTCGL